MINNSKFKLVFDPSSTDLDQDNVGAFTKDAVGNLITSTDNSGKQSLDVHVANSVSASVTGTVDANITNASIAVTSASPLDVNITGGSQEVTGNVADDAADSGSPVKIGARALATLSSLDAGDRADLITDLFRRLYVNSSSNRAGSNSSVSVADTAVQLDSAPLQGRRAISVQNRGNKSIFVAFNNSVTSANGTEIAGGGSSDFEIGENIQLWAIGADASTKDVRILQVS